jgi:hypothetical protein
MAHATAAAGSGSTVASAATLRAATATETRGKWRALFRIAGIGALLTGILIPLQIVAFIVWPLPEGGVVQWFDLFQESPLIALISYDLVMMVEEVLLIPIVLALYLLLRRTSPSLALLACVMWLVSVALFIGSNTAFDMLALSGGYAEAATETERAAYLAAGQAALTGYMQNGTAFVAGYLLASVAGVLVGIAMLRSTAFPRLAGWAAITGNLLGVGLFLPGMGVLLAIGSVVILIVWYLLIGWRMVRLDEWRQADVQAAVGPPIN